ncbi:hypothetical protein EVAR_80123_1 [Eumeta japonica]|uniref:Uncharacterized protein n=1 Tax=Eumeta variegata TaxID=151549 RepID=A0A4C1UDR6_EUMVA|nr:hypothetical protein EVAR_80123_1 [Eumeta japonica]
MAPRGATRDEIDTVRKQISLSYSLLGVFRCNRVVKYYGARRGVAQQTRSNDQRTRCPIGDRIRSEASASPVGRRGRRIFALNKLVSINKSKFTPRPPSTSATHRLPPMVSSRSAILEASERDRSTGRWAAEARRDAPKFARRIARQR